ncbi:MAG: aryl-sulfate sulfotransferase [Clostridium sp.]
MKEMQELFSKQQKIIEDINKEYTKGKYTIENPYININPFEVCPLSALVKFKTEKSAKIKITINNNIINNLKEFKEHHEIEIHGLKANYINKIILHCTYKDGETQTKEIEISGLTLPKEYPQINLIKSHKEKMKRGFISLSLGKSMGVKTIKHLYSILDEEGVPVWVYTGVACHVFSKLKNGNLIVDAPVSSGICGAYTAAGFIEMTFLGRIINFFKIPNGLHHDVIEIPNGNFLAITQRENTKQDLLVEIDRVSKEVINEWDFRKILDPTRETVIDKISVNHPLDWLHLNSLVYDEKSNSIIASSRNQSTVVKFNKDTKEIKWILAPPYYWKEEFKRYLLTPTNEEFIYTYAQHTPVLTKGGNLLVFDNGNFRSYDLENATLAYDNFSRGVEYKIDEDNLKVTEVWQYGKERGNSLYCPYLGAIRVLENDNRLITFGGITKDMFGNPIDDMKADRMKNRTTVVEVKGNEVVFEIQIKSNDITSSEGYKCYRAEKINFY